MLSHMVVNFFIGGGGFVFFANFASKLLHVFTGRLLYKHHLLTQFLSHHTLMKEQLKVIHQAQTESLEAQLISLRSV